jgi:hypothetical protein
MFTIKKYKVNYYTPDCGKPDGKTTFMMTSKKTVNKVSFSVPQEIKGKKRQLFYNLPIYYFLLMAINTVTER